MLQSFSSDVAYKNSRNTDKVLAVGMVKVFKLLTVCLRVDLYFVLHLHNAEISGRMIKIN